MSFGTRGSAERRIAGLSVAARAAAAACGAGADEIWLVADGAPLSADLFDDLRRACPGSEFRQIASPGCERALAEAPSRRTIHLFFDRYLLTASELSSFLSSDAAAVRCGGEVVASKDESGRVEDVPAAIDLARPAAAARRILAGTAKPSDGIVSRWLNRPVSRRISAALLHFEAVRPWHLTVVTAALGALMFLAFLSGGTRGLLFGAILFHVASVVDGVDGEIARATFRSTSRGAVLDTTVDMVTNLLFYLGITISLTRLYGPQHLLAGGWCVLLALAGLLIMRWLVAQVGQQGSFDILKSYYRQRFPSGIPAGIVELLVNLTSRDCFAFVIALLVVLGDGAAVSFLLAGFATLWMVLILAAAPSILRHARRPALDPPLPLGSALR